MTAAESLYQRLGSLSLPPDLDAIAEAKTLTALDPARRILADLFKAAINAELAEAWVAAVANRFSESGPISPTLPVADVLEMRPSKRVMQERQCAFPLLAIYRSGQAEDEPFNIGEYRLKQPWSLDWVLGPVDAATAFQLGDCAFGVTGVVRLVCRAKRHPAYRSGAIQFGDGNPLGSIRVVSSAGPESAPFADDDSGQHYLMVSMILESLEYPGESSDDTVGPLTGADYDYGIGSLDGVQPGIMYSDTDHPGT